ncbi:hypothetical protein PGT21_035710 [Puccinia graminis f. sp. tritici]|uniref:Uncharacterized protein n=1 Tax=Puccinia graminis f. sp. tritici TaxID=56615 RepID=A0A5B0PMY6_PUCGR|nr:hypothetical protein PGT21_035710 [Puccinia graminis f. sp. tritici]
MNASSDVAHDQVLLMSRVVENLSTEPVTHSPKQETPHAATDGYSVQAETFEFEVLTPYDQEPHSQICLEEEGLESLDIGGSAELFSPTHMGPHHGVYSIDHDKIEDYYLSHRPERRNVYPLPSGRQPWLIPSLEPLIADVALAKSRLLITKTHCLYPEKSALIPFSSCLIGFRLVVHPCHPKARLKHVKITLTLHAKEPGPTSSSPIIKSIYPLDGRIHETGERTSVHALRENSVKLNLGVDPYGTATLTHAQSVAQGSYTVPYVLSSGVNTNILLITMDEDSSLKGGVAPSLYFAALLEFPTNTAKSFQAHLQVASQAQKDHPFKMWCSPKIWSLDYDGQTELGSLEFGA